MDLIPPIIKVHLYLFRFLGYFSKYSISLETSAKNISLRRYTYFDRIWAILLFCAFSTLTFFVFFGKEDFRFTGDAFGYFNDTLKVCFAQIAISIFYWESIAKPQQVKIFWNRYINLQRQRCAKRFAHEKIQTFEQVKQHIRFLFIFYGLTMFDLSMYVTFFICKPFSHHLTLFWSMFTPFSLFVHFRNMEFIMYLELIRGELLQLKTDLALMADYTRFATRVRPFVGFQEFLQRKLHEMQKTYQWIYEMFTAFQTAYACSMIAAILMIFVRVLVDTYFMYNLYYLKLNQMEILLLISSSLEIPAFLFISKSCMKVPKQISFELHNIICSLDDMVLSTQLQNFSLQMLHQKIVINGLGMSTMDGYMLSKIIGSITSFMVFFIQFMPYYVLMPKDD